ncbi:MAG: phosphatidylserine decarboxylase [Gammaproteobacteria bacterium]|nr:phosphatidylserine decarboxylase [Gammaproteobacteria bacterium]MYF30606.1 phosphatidylserine decarboxylase [Gammaproteobacteria bacterium]MYK48437.1 phosphatidylserine decarboxylase [Gammaproteobacteria bacterium]
MHLFVALQRALPQHGLSRCLGALAASENNTVKRLLIDAFMSAYRIDMTEFVGDSARDFASFNDFFTRPLLPGSRPMPDDPRAVASPADGTVSQAGRISAGHLVQAKGREYRVSEFLGGADFAGGLANGSFATIYLAPHNYHRVHAPCAGRLIETVEIPGRLFSVNAVTERHVSRLFVRNERLVLRIAAPFGEYALVLVGAMIVASIRATWHGPVSPYRRRRSLRPDGVAFERGQEVGAFLLGSTVVALFPDGAVSLDEGFRPGQHVNVGAPIGTTGPA